MKATIVTMTKSLARDYLSRNNENRKVNKKTLLFYKEQMLSNKWKENGEPIIIDSNGTIKDGQHRLLAVCESDYSYRVPVISGVDTDVMDTIDTGKNRSAADILYLEGFKYSSLIASSVKVILNDSINRCGNHELRISNSDILQYSKKNKIYIYELINQTLNISSFQVARILSDTTILFYLHKYGDNLTTIDFLNNILGSKRVPRTATDYVYKKLFKSHSGDERLSIGDKEKYIQRAYEYFIKGNPTITTLKIKYNNNKVK